MQEGRHSKQKSHLSRNSPNTNLFPKVVQIGKLTWDRPTSVPYKLAQFFHETPNADLPAAFRKRARALLCFRSEFRSSSISLLSLNVHHPKYLEIFLNAGSYKSSIAFQEVCVLSVLVVTSYFNLQRISVEATARVARVFEHKPNVDGEKRVNSNPTAHSNPFLAFNLCVYILPLEATVCRPVERKRKQIKIGYTW